MVQHIKIACFIVTALLNIPLTTSDRYTPVGVIAQYLRQVSEAAVNL